MPEKEMNEDAQVNKTEYPRRPVTLVDDEAQVLIAFSTELRFGGINNVVTCQDSREVLPMLAQKEAEVLLLDISMPHVDGRKLLTEVADKHPEIPIIIITALNDYQISEEYIKRGAYECLTKPLEEGLLVSSVKRAIVHRERMRETNYFHR